MTRVFVLGIDALDSVTLSKLSRNLPNFRSMMDENPHLDCDGVFPPDSPTSWASIYTGLNPAKHGIVLFVDPLSKVSKMITDDVDDSSIRGKTFWDIASEHDKRVCIATHLLGYPVWPVNGVMVGRSGITREVQMYPENRDGILEKSMFRWDLDLFPGRNKKRYIELVKSQVEREADFAISLMKKKDWDIFFVSFGELDVVQYSFWSHHDSSDPSYDSRNPYKNVIADSYRLFDNLIGRFKSEMEEDDVFIIVSDHGIGSRPIKLININEILRRRNLLVQKIGNRHDGSNVSVVQKLKNMILRIVNDLDLGNIAAVVLRAFPEGKKAFISQQNIDYENSKSYLTDQSGIKSYPYGGIVLNRKMIEDSEYEKLRDEIINEFLNLTDPASGKNIVEWIVKREELYSGDEVAKYPDIVFELNQEFGAGNAVNVDLFGKSLSHDIVPGCHKQHHATFLISGLRQRKIVHNKMCLLDVAPTILDLIGIKEELKLDGRSILD